MTSTPDRNHKNILPRSVYLYGIALSLFYGLMILIIGYPKIALEEVGYAIFFGIAHILTRRNLNLAALLLALATILTACVRGVQIFGWDSGVYIYIITTIPLLMTSNMLSKQMKIGLCILILALFAGLGYYGLYHSGSVSFGFLDSFKNELNQLIGMGLISFSFWRYNQAVVTAEIGLREANTTIRHIANIDSLTGIPNRGYTQTLLEKAIQRESMEDHVLIIGMIDIDNFKNINDTYGHKWGDSALKEVSERLQKGLRKDDILGRWGGEEFLVLLKESNLEQGIKTMERLRKMVSDKPVDYNHFSLNVSVTIGVTKYLTGQSLDEVVDAADQCLYKGKHSGKNCVVGPDIH